MANKDQSLFEIHEFSEDEYLLSYGISKPEYDNSLNKLQSKYDLQLKHPLQFVMTKTFFGKEQKGTLTIHNIPAGYILDISRLYDMNIEVQPLINEFKSLASYEDYEHLVSLVFIMSKYVTIGHNVQLWGRKVKDGKNPDFVINGLTADVKVRSANDQGKQFVKKKTNQYSVNLAEEICYDIGSTIQNRIIEGIRQADLLFVDFNSRSLPFMALWDDTQRLKGATPEPKKARIIFYCYPILEPQTKAQAFCATYLDVDPLLWDFISTSKDKIIFTKH